MKVIYRNVTENRLCIWVYENDGKTFVCNVDVKKEPSVTSLMCTKLGADCFWLSAADPLKTIPVDQFKGSMVLLNC